MQESIKTQAERHMTLIRDMQYFEMMNKHYQNHYKMLLCYASLRSIDNMLDSSELEPDDYDEEGVPIWHIDDCSLMVVPSAMADHPYRWTVLEAPADVFRAPLNQTILYLFLPLSSFTRIAELTLQDEVYWIDGSKVMAAGVIEQAMIGNAIVTEQALIVPVVVKPFAHRFIPFDMRDASYGNNTELYRAFESKPATACFRCQISQPGITREQMPPIAVQLNSVIGLDLLNYIDDDYNFGFIQTPTIST